jgi:A118 family predicted phage portal protein
MVLSSLNFAKRVCADDANLCEIVEVNAGKNEEQFAGVLELLRDNRFDVMYRKQLEKMSASGTVGGYIRLDNAEKMSDDTVKGGTIKINYADANCIIPLTIDNEDIIECAFSGENLVRGKKEGTLVVFSLENGLYSADSYFFDEDYKEIPERRSSLQLGDVKPFFVMRTAEVNNIDDMEGYGYPKLYSAIPILKCLDLSYNILFSDLDKGEKMVFINEMLAVIQKDVNNNPTLTPSQKKLFIMMGEKLPEETSIVKEYNPELRIEQITKTFETCLSLLSMMFGYGTKKYNFENGQIKTATEYAGEKQDSMQELNKQRKESTDYITAICKALMWFSNTFHGTTWALDEDICIEFDDSFITDKQTEIETMRADAISFPNVQEFTIQYVMMRLNCEREEAMKYIQNTEEPIDDIDD